MRYLTSWTSLFLRMTFHLIRLFTAVLFLHICFKQQTAVLTVAIFEHNQVCN